LAETTAVHSKPKFQSDAPTISQEALGMSGSAAQELSKVFQVADIQIISAEMQHGVLQCASVAIAQDEAITVDPTRALG
jgi:hypothetical protein